MDDQDMSARNFINLLADSITSDEAKQEMQGARVGDFYRSTARPTTYVVTQFRVGSPKFLLCVLNGNGNFFVHRCHCLNYIPAEGFEKVTIEDIKELKGLLAPVAQ